ncbi:MAG: ComEA family DNA-binding protein [Acidimicrobiales bacterium]
MPDEPSTHDLLDLPEITERDRIGDALAVLRIDPTAAVGTVLVLAALGVGLFLLTGRSRVDPPELVLPMATVEPVVAHEIDTASNEEQELVVHAAGAVRAPGLYVLASSARVADLVEAAGGVLPAADLDRINLAAPLLDGSRVFVPTVGEPVPGVVAEAAGEAAADTPIDINTADVAALDDLPGVGPSTAAAIVEHRERTGPFRSIDDLLEVRGIGPAKLELLRSRISA